MSDDKVSGHKVSATKCPVRADLITFFGPAFGLILELSIRLSLSLSLSLGANS